MAEELIYARGYSDHDGRMFAVPFWVVKRTKTRIYVEWQIYGVTSRAWWDAHPEQRRCFTLDRQEFERTGKAYSRTRNDYFYATKEDAERGHAFVARNRR